SQRSRPPASIVVIAASSRSVNTAPFGSPVVPEVNTTAVTRSGFGGNGGGGVAHARQWRGAMDHEVGRELRDDAIGFGGREPRVDPRGDRAKLREREVHRHIARV